MAIPAMLMDRGLQIQIDKLEKRVLLLEAQNVMQQIKTNGLEKKLKNLTQK
jgi:hypothetical protein